MGKSLSCIAATGTIGAVAVIPKVRSTLASLEKEIGTLEDIKLSPQVNVTETTTSTTSSQDAKTLIKKVTDWLSTNGNCKISLATGEEGKYFEVKEEEGEETTDTNRSLFVPQVGMKGKSKFERLADDLNEENDRKGDNASKYSSYKEEFKGRCKAKKDQIIKLQWRSQISENVTTEDKTNSEKLKGLMNLWVDEKENSVQSQ